MDDERWTTVDSYLSGAFGLDDPVLERFRTASRAAGLPPIDVSAPQGMLLQVLVRLVGARRVLEVGTLGGYSAAWMARGLPPDGRLLSLELEPRHAEVARASLAGAGLDRLVEVRVGPAADSLAALVDAGDRPWDLVFIDADKPNNPTYLELALSLVRPGSAIVVDNVIRGGRIAEPAETAADVEGTRAVLEAMGADDRLAATAIQTVGAKGWDGFAVASVRG